MMNEAIDRVMNTVTRLDQATAVLGWDQETYMPAGAVEARAEQLAVLSGLRHQHMTSEESLRISADVRGTMADMPSRKRRVVQTFLDEQDKAIRLPLHHVEELARATAVGQDAWKRAKHTNNYALFAGALERITELKRSEAEYLGYKEHPYDAMIDLYEPGVTVSQLNPVFAELAKASTSLLDRISTSSASVNGDVLYRSYDKGRQLEFATNVIQKLGFSLPTGRVDLSEHPFCTSFGSTDVRLTTRIHENDLRSCLFGLIHEAGHGMYEQGLGADLQGTLSAQGASMGIHESQSLFWENVIARSEEFWQWAFPLLRKEFPDQLAGETPTSFFKAINHIQRSLNRVESDELTYNLHIILRFEIERDLMVGALAVKDIPQVWNDKMQALLGIVPESDSEGCLQDVHWSFGGIGYFPSYTLGKLYAAMLRTAMQDQLPDMWTKVSNGEFSSIREWLRVHIHDVGKTETPNEIVQRVCHSPLTPTAFLEYVSNKATLVYGL